MFCIFLCVLLYLISRHGVSGPRAPWDASGFVVVIAFLTVYVIKLVCLSHVRAEGTIFCVPVALYVLLCFSIALFHYSGGGSEIP